jgi:hypothetical protein
LPIYDPLLSSITIGYVYYDKNIFKSKDIDEFYFTNIYTYQMECPEEIGIELSTELKNELKKYIKDFLLNHKWEKLSIKERLRYVNECINERLNWVRILSNNKDLNLCVDEYFKNRKNRTLFKFDFDFSRSYINENNELVVPKMILETNIEEGE